jgi:hypothetical protein
VVLDALNPHVFSLTSPAEGTTPRYASLIVMKDEQTARQRLEELRGQLQQWGTPELRVSVVSVITKDELRGWIRALEWILAPTGR